MMGSSYITGLLMIVVAGLFAGSFSVPFNRNREWVWENNWLVWSFIALVAAPWIVAWVTIPDITAIFASESRSLLAVAFFGLIWGAGAVLFGKGIDLLGVGLSMPIMLGLTNVIGTLIPVILRSPAELLAASGIRLMAGVFLIVLGIVFYAVAGERKVRDIQASVNNNNMVADRSFLKGLMVCLAAGVLSPMINVAVVYGAPMQEQAVMAGADPIYATNVVWCIALTAGCIVNVGYCLYLLYTRGTRELYRKGSWRNWMFAVVAGVLWYMSMMIYGMGGHFLGDAGTSVGWALMQSLAVLTGNLSGLFMGEWKDAGTMSRRIMWLGLGCMLLGIVVVAI